MALIVVCFIGSLFDPSLGADINGPSFKSGKLDKDGLPYIGRYMTQGEPYYWYGKNELLI